MMAGTTRWTRLSLVWTTALLLAGPAQVSAEDAATRSWAAWFREARARSQGGDAAGTNEAYRKAIEAARISSEDPVEIERNVTELARLLLAWGRFDEACGLYSDLAREKIGRPGAAAADVFTTLRPQITACAGTAARPEVGAMIGRDLDLLAERAAAMSVEERTAALMGLVDGAWDAQAADLVVPHASRLLELAGALLPEGDEHIAVLQERLGAAYLMVEPVDPARSAELLRAAGASWEAIEGEVSVGRARSLMALASALAMGDDVAGSETASLDAVATLEALGPESEPLLVQALFQLGRLYVQQGRKDEVAVTQARIDALTEKLDRQAEEARAARSRTPAKGEIPSIVTRGLMERETREKLMRGRFAELDELETSLREERKRDESGLLLIHSFHAGLIPPENADLGGFWNLDLQRIKDWQKERPDSLAAKIAEADYWLRYGWRVRGEKLAKEVGETERDVFKQHLEKSRSLLEALGDRGKQSPRWYRLMLTVDRGLGRPDDEHREVFEEGVARFPEDVSLYVQRGHYVTPQWFGSWDRVAELADWSASESHGGPAMYARYYWGLFQGLSRPTWVFDHGKARWDTMKASFQAMLAEYPAPWNRHALAYFACLAKDRETAREAFQAIGEKGPYSLWGRDRFDECRSWALGDP